MLTVDAQKLRDKVLFLYLLTFLTRSLVKLLMLESGLILYYCVFRTPLFVVVTGIVLFIGVIRKEAAVATSDFIDGA